MSTLNVDKVDPSTGTALEIGSSGDTITVPSGATFAVSGTMNASSITAGTVATARLGTGTASSSTVLYGDQTYKAEPTGVALTGSTDNTVVTVTGADAIAGETSMTYDGTTLALTTSGGGLKLDGLASSNVNTLDDYEEGTYTTNPENTTDSGGNLTGFYTKVGDVVSISWYSGSITLASSSGAARALGLPFAAKNVTNYVSAGSIGYNSGCIDGNSRSIYFWANQSRWTAFAASSDVGGNWVDGSGCSIVLAGTYHTET